MTTESIANLLNELGYNQEETDAGSLSFLKYYDGEMIRIVAQPAKSYYGKNSSESRDFINWFIIVKYYEICVPVSFKSDLANALVDSFADFIANVNSEITRKVDNEIEFQKIGYSFESTRKIKLLMIAREMANELAREVILSGLYTYHKQEKK